MSLLDIQYLIIIAVVLIILLAVLKANKKDANIDLNKLVENKEGKEKLKKKKLKFFIFILT